MAKKAKTESKHFWKYIKCKVKTQSNVTNLEKMDSSLTKSEKEKAEVLNDFFSSVFTRENCDRIPDFEEKEFETPLGSININVSVVEKVLKELNA